MMLIAFLLGLALVNAQNSSSKIVGGSTASQSRYESTYSYVVKVSGCTATAISSRWILGAGHCGKPSSVYHGSTKRNSGTKTSISTVRVLSSSSGKDDLAMYRTSSSMSGIRFPNVHGVSSSTKLSLRGKTGTIAGWGATSSTGSGSSSMKYLSTNITRESSDSSRTLIETQAPSGQGHCYGDSGGSLTWNGILVGVTSIIIYPSGTSESRRCEAGRGGFVDTYRHRNWIKAQMASFSRVEEEPELASILEPVKRDSVGECVTLQNQQNMYAGISKLERIRKNMVQRIFDDIDRDQNADEAAHELMFTVVEQLDGMVELIIDETRALLANPIYVDCLPCYEVEAVLDEALSEFEEYLESAYPDWEASRLSHINIVLDLIRDLSESVCPASPRT